jgi:hypothetical protein
VVAHLPQGKRAAFGIAILAIFFHTIYALTESLFAPILMHCLYDSGIFTILFYDERRRLANPQVEQKLVELAS